MTEKRALITNVDLYMGKAIAEKFADLGIEVVTGLSPLSTQAEVESLVNSSLETGPIDILVANLAKPPMTASVENIQNEDWHVLFDHLVHPLMYLVRSIVPHMKARESAAAAKIIAVTSAAPLKGIANNGAYCAARAAQNGFVKAVGLELARDNIHVNAIAQNYINNNTYYPDEILDNEKFLAHVKKNVPTNKVGAASETAELAAYLASDNCNHMVGQIIPLAGGWAN